MNWVGDIMKLCMENIDKKEDSDQSFYGNRYRCKLDSSPNGENWNVNTHGQFWPNAHMQILSSKNLSTGEKLAMMEEFQKEVALENEKKRLEGNKLGADVTNNKAVILQLECERSNDRKDTWTDSQIAKKAGVGVGSVARYPSPWRNRWISKESWKTY